MSNDKPERFSDEWLEGYIQSGIEFWSKMAKRELTAEEIEKFRRAAMINNQNKVLGSYSVLAMMLHRGRSGLTK